jgi:integrase
MSNLRKRGTIYHFRAEHNGREITQSLHTSDQKLARQRARKLKEQLRAGRWEELMGHKNPAPCSTLGEILDAYRIAGQDADIRPRTVHENISALRRILRTVHGDDYDVEAAPASILTEQLLYDYQTAKVSAAKAAGGPVAIDHARSTSYSTARQARSVLSRECLRHRAYRALELPDLSGFLRARLKNKERRLREAPSPDLIARTAEAATALRQENPALWLAFILCSNLGLRRSEAIAARWDWVEEITVHGEKARPDGSVQQVQTTCYVMRVIKREHPRFDPKGSPRLISIHPEVWQAMQSHQVSIDTIVPGTPHKRLEACKENVAWLRSLGWDARLPNHALRGLFASTIASQHGLFAAQSALGHADPRTTTESYATWLGLDKVVKVF